MDKFQKQPPQTEDDRQDKTDSTCTSGENDGSRHKAQPTKGSKITSSDHFSFRQWNNQRQGKLMRLLLPLFGGHKRVRRLRVLRELNLVKKTCHSTVYVVTTYVMTNVLLHVLYCCATAVVVLFFNFLLIMILTTGQSVLQRI